MTKVSGPVGLSDAGNNLSPNGVGGLDSGHHFSVGDLVQICSDMERMKVRFTVCNLNNFKIKIIIIIIWNSYQITLIVKQKISGYIWAKQDL